MMRREPNQWVCSDLSGTSERDNLKDVKVNRNRKGRNSCDPKVILMLLRYNYKHYFLNRKPKTTYLFRLLIMKCSYFLEISYWTHSSLKDS